MNSMASVTATNRRWEKAVDGTSTQVVTYLINRWKARINWEGLYNVRILPWKKEGEKKKKEKKKKKGRERRGTRSKNRNHLSRAKEKVLLDKLSSPLCDHLETPWLMTVRSPRPSLLAHSLQIHCIGPVCPRSHPSYGVGLKNEALQLAPSVGKTYALAQTTVSHGRIKPLSTKVPRKK